MLTSNSPSISTKDPRRPAASDYGAKGIKEHLYEIVLPISRQPWSSRHLHGDQSIHLDVLVRSEIEKSGIIDIP